MNQLVLIGRITRKPEIKYSQGANPTAYGNYTIAVDRPTRRDAEKVTDFIDCKVVGQPAEFAEKYLDKGIKIAITGRIQKDNYTDREGNKKSNTYVQVLSHEFCESKGTQTTTPAPPQNDNNGFVNIPDSLMEELPFM